MLDPEYLLHISEGAEDIAEQLHSDIIARVIERMMIRLGNGEEYLLTSADKWRLQTLQDAGYLLEDIQAEIASKTRLQIEEIKEAMEEAGVKAISYDDKIYQAAGLSPASLEQSPSLIRVMQRNYEATCGEWTNFTRTMAQATQQNFIASLDKAYVLVTSGALSYTEAVREAVNEMIKSGADVLYGKRADSIETATLRAVRTGISQMSGQVQITRMDEMDCDLVLVSSHLGARPEHQEWQGKVYSRSGKSSKYPDFVASTKYGSVTGLCGANCRHNFGPYFEGMDNPFDDYDSEENLKAYEEQQRQRELERRIRSTKREVMGLKHAVENAKSDDLRFSLQEAYERKAKLLTRQNNDYDVFCEEHNLKKLRDRISIARWDRKQAAKARGAAMKKTKINSPINSRNTAMGKPSAILQYDVELNKRQKSLLASLPEYESSVIVKKNKVKMTDLSALTAKTGVEFAMFTKGNERLIVRGNGSSVKITVDKAKEMAQNGYKWSGHTHPGTSPNCMQASLGDMEILKSFNQGVSVIYNSLGQHKTFDVYLE